jgi:hypothetical protein
MGWRGRGLQHVPALPGCYSQGASVEETLANAVVAVRGYVAALEYLRAAVWEESTETARDAPAAIEPALAHERVLLSCAAA